MGIIVTKICSICKAKKPLSDFPKENRNKSGYRADCKECRKNYSKNYFQKNADRLKNYMREYYQNNTQSALDKAKRWYEENKEKHAEHSRKYKKTHIELYRASCRRATKKWMSAHPEYRNQWRERNPNKGRQYNQTRRAKVKEVGGEITAEEWKQLLDFYGHRCLCCKRTEDEVAIHIDHIVPISKGGRNVIENAQPLCKSCNSAKHDKIIDYRKSYD